MDISFDSTELGLINRLADEYMENLYTDLANSNGNEKESNKIKNKMKKVFDLKVKISILKERTSSES